MRPGKNQTSPPTTSRRHRRFVTHRSAAVTQVQGTPSPDTPGKLVVFLPRMVRRDSYRDPYREGTPNRSRLHTASCHLTSGPWPSLASFARCFLDPLSRPLRAVLGTAEHLLYVAVSVFRFNRESLRTHTAGHRPRIQHPWHRWGDRVLAHHLSATAGNRHSEA